MINTPPNTSSRWTPAERLGYLAWLLAVSIERIEGDDPTVPILAKGPTRALFQTALAVANWGAEHLEANRIALMKPFDSALNHHSVLIPSEWMDALRQFSAKAGPPDPFKSSDEGR